MLSPSDAWPPILAARLAFGLQVTFDNSKNSLVWRLERRRWGQGQETGNLPPPMQVERLCVCAQIYRQTLFHNFADSAGGGK